MTKINWTNLLIIVALAAAAIGLFLPMPLAPAAPSASTQAFQCAPGAMCVQNGGKVVSFPDGSTLGVMSGATFTATDFTAGTITATTLISQAVGFAGATADLTGAVTADSATITGTVAAGSLTSSGNVTITGDTHAGTVYVDGYLRSAVGPVTSFDPLTALKEFTATKGVIINGHTFTETGLVTVTGLCTACRVLIYQP